jgi:multidrug resistance efflux pump
MENQETVVQEDQGEQTDPVHKFTFILLGIIAFLLVWYVLADRYTPWTDQSRVKGWIVPITPKVSGKLIR